jgi:hypothetical protein
MLGGWGVSVAAQFADELARRLAATGRDALEPLGVLAFNAEH